MAKTALPTSFGSAAIASVRALRSLNLPARRNPTPPKQMDNSAPSSPSSVGVLNLLASILGYVARPFAAARTSQDSLHYPQGIWKCVGVESGTSFTEVEFEGSEWVDYDEKVRTSREIMTIFTLN